MLWKKHSTTDLHTEHKVIKVSLAQEWKKAVPCMCRALDSTPSTPKIKLLKIKMLGRRCTPITPALRSWRQKDL
jgi:hypothetical protein